MMHRATIVAIFGILIGCCHATIPAIGVFIQIKNARKLTDIVQCVGNIVEAKRMLIDSKESRVSLKNPIVKDFNIDVLVSYIPSDPQSNQTEFDAISHNFGNFGNSLANIYIKEVENVGMDVGQFLNQVKLAEGMKKSYDLVLKLHSKSHKEWADYSTECLCGTPSHVISIISEFMIKKDVHMVAPQGLLFSSITPKVHIHPLLRELYFKTAPLSAAFSPTNIQNMHGLFKVIFNKDLLMPDKKLVCDAGTMFWARYAALRPTQIVAALPKLANRWTKGYVQDNGIEHALERLIPTWITYFGGKLAQIISAPKVLPLYFPQYHQIPENDKFHGEGFTEWTILKPLKDYPGLMKPLSEEKGGLGYYNLTEKRVRVRQRELAHAGGVYGFVYYHYWFSGPKAPINHIVMNRIPEMMIEDGEPALPFMFSWANEPWTRTWDGFENDVLLSQEYGERDDWVLHFYYLLPFFKHPRYIRINGKPAFVVYRIGHFKEKLQTILSLWNDLAKKNGLDGIYFVNTLGNFMKRDSNTYDVWKKSSVIEGAFQFRPQIRDPFNQEVDLASKHDIALPSSINTTQYWGAYSSFDARPRRPNASPVRGSFSPKLFETELTESFQAMAQTSTRFVSPNLYFVTAWNEWNEQAVLEPDERNEFGYLRALKTALETIQCKEFVQ